MSEETKETDQSTSDESPKKSSGNPIKYFFWLLVIIIVVFTGTFLFVAERTRDTFMDMFRTYRPQKVVSTFNEYRDLFVQGNEGNILEVATGEEVVELTRTDSVKILGRIVPGVTQVSRIVVPATFRYHIDLNGNWDMIDDGNRLHVIAPKIQPSLPVAFDTEKMEKINESWARYLTGSNMSELEKSITPKLISRAQDPEMVAKFREEAKTSIAKFLSTWLTSRGAWEPGQYEQIIVYFEGELVDTDNPETEPDLKVDEPAL